MKLTVLVFCALMGGACSQSENDRAREQARQGEEQLKHDSRVALNKAEVEAKKANKVLSQDLDKARAKVRGAIDEHESDSH
jgi:hypothetical protein